MSLWSLLQLAVRWLLVVVMTIVWVALGFVVATLIGAPLQAGRADDDSSRAIIGLVAFAVGMAVAFVGSVWTMRWIARHY